MKRLLTYALCALLLVPATACSTNAAKPLQTVRLAEVTHSVFYAAQYIAMEKGYFAEEGLQIELTNAGGADKAMTALLSGNADIALMGPEASVYVYNEGRDDYAQVVGQLTACDGAFILGREKIENFTLHDLKGKSILGGRAGGMPLMALKYAIRQSGLDPETDVEVMDHVQFNLMAGAFAGGEGDFTTLFEPTATEFELEGSGYVLCSVGEYAGPVPYTCYQVTREGLNKNSDMIERFMRAIYKGQTFLAQSDSKTAAEALRGAFADTDIAVLEKVVERYRAIGAFATQPTMEEEHYNRLLDIMEQAGELSARPPFADMINNDLAAKAMK